MGFAMLHFTTNFCQSMDLHWIKEKTHHTLKGLAYKVH